MSLLEYKDTTLYSEMHEKIINNLSSLEDHIVKTKKVTF